MSERRRLVGSRVELHRLEPADIDALGAIWERDASVRARWTSNPREDLERLLHVTEHEGGWTIRVDGELVGYIQHYEEADPDYRHAGMDIFLAQQAQGEGYGTDAVRTLARHLVDDLGHHRLVIDPAADNARAIACYAKVGFRPVGVMRRYERGPDGTWHDGLLMDVLADELA